MVKASLGCFVMFALTAMADSFISFRQQGGAFPISTASQMSGICMDAHEKQDVKRAGGYQSRQQQIQLFRAKLVGIMS